MPTGKITPISNLVGKIDKGAGTNDHNKLINRDLTNQHPIEAITGLLGALNQLDSKISTLDQKIDSEVDFVASELALIRSELGVAQETLTILINKVSSDVQELSAELNSKISEVTALIEQEDIKLNQVEQQLLQKISQLEDKVDSNKQTFDEYKRTTDNRLDNTNLRIDGLKNQVDNLTIEELSRRKAVKVYQKKLNDCWAIAETFNPETNYFEEIEDTESKKVYYKRIKFTEEQPFEPGRYWYYKETGINITPKGEFKKNSGYYPAYTYDKNATYYELVYDSNPDDIIGIWKFNDGNLEVPVWGYEINKERGYEHTMWLWDRGEICWYEGDEEHTADMCGVLGYNYIASSAPYPYQYVHKYNSQGELNFAINTTAIGIAFGPSDQGGVGPLGMRSWYAGYMFAGKDLCPGWQDEDIIDETEHPYKTVDDIRRMLMHFENPSWTEGKWIGNCKKIWIKQLANNSSTHNYLKRNATKLSDELLANYDTNYKTKYKKVELTAQNFEPGKYYIYYQTPREVSRVQTQSMILSKNYVQGERYYVINNYDLISKEPVYKQVIVSEYEFYHNYKTDYYKLITEEDRVVDDGVVRIQLDPEESIYRDYDGNDVVKIVDDNVLLNGEPLSPTLTIDSSTYPNKVLETNAEEIYDKKLDGLRITIPNTAKHGFCSYISFEPSSRFRFNIDNKSSYKLRIITNGAEATLNDLEFSDECQYNVMFLCNGVYIELYIQEIQLLD